MPLGPPKLCKTRVHDDLDLALRIGQGFESMRDTAQPNHTGNQRLRINPPLGDITQRCRELIRCVPVDELKLELFYNGQEGLDRVGLHAYASHENPGCRRCRFDQALQYPRNADTFEDHRPFGGTTAHYREVSLQSRGWYPKLAPPRVRALLRGIDHDVGA